MSDLGDIVALALTRAYASGIVELRIDQIKEQNKSRWISYSTRGRNIADIKAYQNDLWYIQNQWDKNEIESYLVREFQMTIEEIRISVKRSSSNL